MPSFTYIGHNGEHVVGLGTTNLTAAQYDALSDDLKQAVYINRGSDGGPLYSESAPVYANPGFFPIAEDISAESPAPENEPLLDQPAEGAN